MQLRFLSFWLGAGALELPFLMAFVGGGDAPLEQHWPTVLAMHLLSALLMTFSISRKRLWFRGQTLWPSTLAFLAFFVPLLGWAVSGILFLEIMKERPGEILDEQLTMFAADEDQYLLKANPLSRPERVMRELDFLPLADILAGDDVDLKRGAIDRLAEYRTPEAVDILLGRRSDASQDVRFYVTAALARVKKEFDEELEAAKQAMQKDVRNVEARVFLARTYLRYARSHLLDDVSVGAYEREASYHLEFAIRSGRAGAEAFRLLAEVHRSRLEWEEAVRLLQELETSKGEGTLSRIQILYQAGRYADVTRELTALKAAGKVPSGWDGIANWWSGR